MNFKCCKAIYESINIAVVSDNCYLSYCDSLKDCCDYSKDIFSFNIHNYKHFFNKRQSIITNNCSKCIYSILDISKNEFKPKNIYLSLSSLCNSNCYYCGGRYLVGNIDYCNKILSLIEKYFISSAETIYWQTGEFYFDKNLQEIYLNWRKKYNLKLNVVTNCVDYNPNIEIDKIYVTLHGFDKNSYIKNCNVDIFDKIYNNVKLIPIEKFSAAIAIMNWYNVCNVDKYAEYIKSIIPKSVDIVIKSCQLDSYQKDINSARSTELKLRNLLENDYNIIFNCDS
jgi:hypothetical protein